MQSLSLSGRTVCLVDDDDLARKAMALKFREHGISVLEAASGSELYEIMGREAPDCIFLDYELTSENGLFVQDQLRSRFLDVPPVIMLTVNDNQRTIIKAFRTGVQDYLLKKGLRSEELIQSLQTAIDRRTEATASKVELERMKNKIDIEDITGLYRPSALDAMLDKLVQTSSIAHKRFSIISIRFDELEVIQVQAGQVAGKRAVAAIASRLRGVLRNTDICGRDKAGAFTYIVDTGTTQKILSTLVERLREALTFEFRHEALTFNVTPSFGCAQFPADGTTADAMLQAARVALDNVAAGKPSVTEDEPEDNAAAVGTERRRSLRQRVFKGGKIRLNDGKSVFDCMVRDMSPGGARLKLMAPSGLPERFDLVISGVGQAQATRLVWQQGVDVGVQFL